EEDGRDRVDLAELAAEFETVGVDVGVVEDIEVEAVGHGQLQAVGGRLHGLDFVTLAREHEGDQVAYILVRLGAQNAPLAFRHSDTPRRERDTRKRELARGGSKTRGT